MFKKVPGAKNLIFAGLDCRNLQKGTWSKISHFDRSGPVEISKKVLRAKFLIFEGPDRSKFPKKYLEQNVSF